MMKVCDQSHHLLQLVFLNHKFFSRIWNINHSIFQQFFYIFNKRTKIVILILKYCIVIEEHLTEGKQVLWIKYCIQGFLVGDNTVTVLLVKFKKCLLYQEELTFVNFCGQQKYENVKVQIEVFQKLHFLKKWIHDYLCPSD